MSIVSKLIANKESSPAELHLSVSKVKTFDDCKAKYKFGYIEKLPRKEWEHHTFGKYLHEVLESYHKELIINPALDSDTLFDSCINKALEKYGAKLTDDLKLEALGIIDSYRNLLQKQKDTGTMPVITNLELPFYIDIDGKILLNGFIDRVQRDVDSVIHVADYKTTKNKRYLKDYFQLVTYAFALMLNDQSIDKIRASFILLRHNCEFITKEYTRKDVEKIEEKFIKYAELINEEKLWRPNPTPLCEYCDYVEQCKDGRRYLVKRGKLQDNKFGFSEW